MSKGLTADHVAILCVTVIAAGFAFRLAQYVANRSLWGDEGALALNIVNRSFLELAEPLDRNQGAPLGFLFVEKFFSLLLGNRDYVLRIFPLVCGLASLIAMYSLARRIFVERVSVFAAVVLFAISDQLIYYASELKQYSSDVLICLLLLLVCERCFRRNCGDRDFALLASVGAIGLWFSHPALFTLAGAGTALGLYFMFNRDWQATLRLGGVVGIWVASFSLLYFISLRQLSENNYLRAFWRFGFMPLPPWRNWEWFTSTFVIGSWPNWIMDDPVGLPSISAVLLLTFGIVSICLRRWHVGAMLLFPILFTLAASSLHLYPFAMRMVLFLVPIFFLFMAEALGRISSLFDQLKLSSRVGPAVAVAVLVWVAIVPVREAVGHVWPPRLNQEIKPILSYLSIHRTANDLVYVYYGAEEQLLFYSELYGIPKQKTIYGSAHRGNLQQYIEELNQLGLHGRVWFIFSHNVWDEEAYFLTYLEKIGKRLDQFSAENSNLYLYDLYTRVPLHGRS
jgi:hypothetical protein